MKPNFQCSSAKRGQPKKGSGTNHQAVSIISAQLRKRPNLLSITHKFSSNEETELDIGETG